MSLQIWRRFRSCRLQATALPTGTRLISDLTGLYSLYLVDNQLTSFPAGLLSGLTNLEIFDTSLNSINPCRYPSRLKSLGTASSGQSLR